jgi:flagellar basal-body rod protein FlgG
MIHGLYHSASAMLVNEYRQNVIANNLANADTVGYARDIPTFAERDPAAIAGEVFGESDPLLDPLSGGIWLGQTHTVYGRGNMVHTYRALDVAVRGDGFLAVQTDQGTQFTRDGRLMVNGAGQLVSVLDGNPVAGVGGLPILLNPIRGEQGVEIDEEGFVRQDKAIVGQIQVVNFDDYDTLRKVGASRVDGSKGRLVPSTATLASRVLENSSADPLREVVDMMEATRAYQLNAQMITTQDATVGRLVSVIAR